jgi:hypothetical protein
MLLFNYITKRNNEEKWHSSWGRKPASKFPDPEAQQCPQGTTCPLGECSQLGEW